MIMLLSVGYSPLLLPLVCPGSCLMQCPPVLSQKSTSAVSAPTPQQRMPSGCHLCPWAWILPLQQLQLLLTTTPATYPTLPSHHTGNRSRFGFSSFYFYYSYILTSDFPHSVFGLVITEGKNILKQVETFSPLHFFML